MDYWPGAIHKDDFEGLPVWYERIGKADPKSIFANLTEDDLVEFHIYLAESREKLLYEVWRNRGQMSEGSICLQDCTDLGWKHMHSQAISTVKKLAALDANHYPETLKKMYVVNTPGSFTMFYKMLKPFLDPKTIQKIQIVSGNGFNELKQDIVKENIPKFLGGESDCPFLDKAGGVYGKSSSEEEEHWDEVQISAKDKFELKFKLKKDDLVAYRFRCDSKDIGFQVSEEISKSTLVPYTRYDQGKTIEGEVTAPIEGEYLLRWDNSFSKLTKKKIKYSIHIEQQSEGTPAL
eukprot:TRINITY_DN2724_c0_g1_i2.p1 TRINITY_DN2724_c0_g1~~TRINITY_DN2724_c0_g1_i2.p1  ORF type:complete len:292 (-),score=93.81 TRINITY_DN2724_c0_g1_i2:7-882(-)